MIFCWMCILILMSCPHPDDNSGRWILSCGVSALISRVLTFSLKSSLMVQYYLVALCHISACFSLANALVFMFDGCTRLNCVSVASRCPARQRVIYAELWKWVHRSLEGCLSIWSLVWGSKIPWLRRFIWSWTCSLYLIVGMLHRATFKTWFSVECASWS